MAASRGVAGGVASLDATGNVPSSQLGLALPTGVFVPFGGAIAPTGWLLCDGSAVSRSTYAALFAAIGTAWGAGDGASTFNLPDMRGRVAAGRDDMGGTAANRLTSGGSGINGATLGAAGGAQTHTLVVGEMPAHTHQQTGNTGQATSAGSFQIAGNLSTVPINHTQSAGGGGAHNNTQPTAVANYIIKT